MIFLIKYSFLNKEDDVLRGKRIEEMKKVGQHNLFAIR